MVCAAVVTIPGFVALAGAKLNTPAVMVAPLAVEEAPIVPIVVATVPVEVEPSYINRMEYPALLPLTPKIQLAELEYSWICPA